MEMLAFLHKHQNAKRLYNPHNFVIPVIDYTMSLLVCIEHTEQLCFKYYSLQYPIMQKISSN